MVTAFFRALAFVITGSQYEHEELRAITTTYMQHNAGILSCYLNAHETMDEYLARTDMHSSSVWATEIEIFAVSNMLQTPIMVFCKSGHTYKWLQFLPHPCEAAVLNVQCIPKKLFIWSTYPTTMNLLGECNSINSMYMHRV